MRSALLAFAVTLAGAADFPAPVVDPSPRDARPTTAVLAGGCFWGVEAVFEQLNGVLDVVSGYTGGDPSLAQYENVSTGRTGHAEAVQVTYDPAVISYGRLLQVFFSVAHDPTQLNRQGPDAGTQYRSAIFYGSTEQRRVAGQYIRQLTAARVFKYPIVTHLVPLAGFIEAEDEHQDYVALHPREAYVVTNDLPKLAQLRRLYPELPKAQ